MDEAEAAATRRKNIDSELAKENDRRAADKRLPGRDLATLLRATNTFFTPTPRPDADAAWGKTPEGRRSLLDVISYNLRLGADALEVPHLGAEAAKSAARAKASVVCQSKRNLERVNESLAVWLPSESH